METVTTKSIFVSKTMWVNLLSLVVLILTSLMDSDLVKQYPNAVLYLGMVLTALNMWLRTQTIRPVSVGGNDIRTLKATK